MKALSLILMVCLVVSCNRRSDIRGAYKMLSQHVKLDTIEQTLSHPQLKLYTETYMMFASYNSSISNATFCIGPYTYMSDHADETVVYRASDSLYIDTPFNYVLQVEPTEKGYKQVIRDMELRGQKFTLTEEYEYQGTPIPSPLDGAWLLETSYKVSGNDTSRISGTQYKTYYAGNFIFGHTWLDSLNIHRTSVVFGTFEMKDEKTAREIVQGSNFSDLIGRSFDVNLSFNGPDEFTQTIKDGNGILLERYRKLGK